MTCGVAVSKPEHLIPQRTWVGMAVVGWILALIFAVVGLGLFAAAGLNVSRCSVLARGLL